jgi:hypothetical protein
MATRFTSTESNGELILYDAETDRVHILNPAAREIRLPRGQGLNPRETALEPARRFSAPPGNDLLADMETAPAEPRTLGIIA